MTSESLPSATAAGAAESHPNPRPSGTVTFMFTDIEGSTRRWERNRRRMQLLVAEHDRLLRVVVAKHQGYVFKMVGDACCAAFGRASDAVATAVAVQLELSSVGWNQDDPISVRIALHTGVTEERDTDYFGPTVNRVARLLSAGHGGQILVSRTTRDLVFEMLPNGVTLTDLGEHRLKDLSSPEVVFQVSAAELWSEFPPLKTLIAARSNLPIQVTSFIGREKETAQIGALLREPDIRLLTLTGTGGSGKTRLAMQVGAEAIEDFPDGVFASELAPLMEPAQVMTAIRASLGIPEGANGELASTTEYLGQKICLLIVDNFEHLVEARSRLVDIMKFCPHVKILITSRVALRVSGEHVHAIAPMVVPARTAILTLSVALANESVRLFVARARAARTDFLVEEGNMAAIAGICERLDGLPLAIELAAARVRMLPPQAILARLGKADGGSLNLLTGGASDGSSRYRNLRAAIDWSYGLLDPSSRTLLTRVSVFLSGCTLEAAESVCGDEDCDVFGSLETLVDSSLVRQAESVVGNPRYAVLETIREYGNAHLTDHERAELRLRHAEYFLQMVEELAVAMRTSTDQSAQLDRLQADHENVRRAIDSFLEVGRREDASWLAGWMGSFWVVRGPYTQARDLLNRVLPEAGSDCDRDRYALRAAGSLARQQGAYEAASSLDARALALAVKLSDSRLEASCQVGLSWVAVRRGQAGLANALLEKAITAAKVTGDAGYLAAVSGNFAVERYLAGDYQAAERLNRESLSAARGHGNEQYATVALSNLAEVLRAIGNLDEAWSAGTEALSIAIRLGVKNRALETRSVLGRIQHERGKAYEAAEIVRQCIVDCSALNLPSDLSSAFENLAAILAGAGRYEQAARVWGAAEAIHERLGEPMKTPDVTWYEGWVARARGQIPETEWQAAWQSGRGMSLQTAAEYALSIQLPDEDTTGAPDSASSVS